MDLIFLWLASTEIFDFETNKWQSMNGYVDSRCRCGIYFDEQYTNNIYIGGGNNSFDGKAVDCYDLYKHKWLTIMEETKYIHKSYPQIWKTNNNSNILYILSANAGECLDLRMNKVVDTFYARLNIYKCLI